MNPEEKKFLMEGVVFEPIKLLEGMRPDILHLKVLQIKNNQQQRLDSFNKYPTPKPYSEINKNQSTEEKSVTEPDYNKAISQKLKTTVDIE